MTDFVDVLGALQEDAYNWDDLQVLRYDKTNLKQFPDDYLAHIYNLCRQSKRRSGDGILTAVFGGNPASDFNSIVTFLAQRPVLIIMGKWVDGQFKELGFAFSILGCGAQNTEKSVFAGYGFFKDAWGTKDQEIATMLGLAYLFQEVGLAAIHGVRFKENLLTAKFMERFGFKQVGEIPYYQLKVGKLVSGVVSTLLRADFEEYVRNFLLSKWRESHTATIGTAEHPAVEESRETIDAQVARLAAGQIPVVFFPLNSTYLPKVPDLMEICMVDGGPGAGLYFFNPQMTSKAEIESAAAEGRHGELLGHVQNKAEIAPTAPTVVVQALDADGTVLRDSVVTKDAESIAAQIIAFKQLFPDCEIKVRDPLDVIDDRVAAKKTEAQLPLNWL